MSNALNQRPAAHVTDETGARPDQLAGQQTDRTLPADVLDMLSARAKRLASGTDAALLAIAEQPKIDALIAQHPGQILLHVLAIRNYLDMRSLRPGRTAQLVRGHLIHIEAAQKHAFPQKWKPGRPDTTRIGATLLDLAEGGYANEAARLLRGVQHLFHDPSKPFARSYAQLNIAPPARQETPPAQTTALAPRERPVKDDPGDAWGGHEVQFPHMASNKQWEFWMSHG